MFNPENWNWAVWVIVVLQFLNVILSPLVHGRDRGKWDGFSVIFSAAFYLSLMYFGGLFA